MHVIDANVFIHGSEHELPFESMVTIPEVTQEIESQQAQQRFEATDIDLREPSEGAIETVEQQAQDAGQDISQTDIRLIALAHQLGATLVTDDYGMQNIAHQLQIDVEPFLKDGIDDTAAWKRVCPNCERDLQQDTCPICGVAARKVSQN